MFHLKICAAKGRMESIMEKRLYKSNVNKMISGVCGGVAEYFGIDPTFGAAGMGGVLRPWRQRHFGIHHRRYNYTEKSAVLTYRRNER